MNDDAPAQAEAEKPGKKPTVTLKALEARVQTATGRKPMEVRVIVEAAMKEIGAALRAGDSMRLPGFGIIRVLNPKDAGTEKAIRLAVRPLKEREPRADRPAGAAKPSGAKPGAKAGAKPGGGKGAGARGAKAKQALAATPKAD